MLAHCLVYIVISGRYDSGVTSIVNGQGGMEIVILYLEHSELAIFYFAQWDLQGELKLRDAVIDVLADTREVRDCEIGY